MEPTLKSTYRVPYTVFLFEYSLRGEREQNILDSGAPPPPPTPATRERGEVREDGGGGGGKSIKLTNRVTAGVSGATKNFVGIVLAEIILMAIAKFRNCIFSIVKV